MCKTITYWRQAFPIAALVAVAIFLRIDSGKAAETNAPVPDLMASAVSAYQTGNNDLAIADFTLLIQAGSREAYWGRARAFYQNRDYGRAITDLNSVIHRDPEAAAFNLRGHAFFELGDYRDAVVDFTRALQTRPLDPDLLLGRADAWFYQGKAARALADYTQTIRVCPTNALAYAHRGELNAAYKHDYRRGITDCLTAISLDAHCWLAYNNLAALLAICPNAKFRDGQVAILQARKACELTAWKNPLPLSILAAACAETGDFADAIKWQQQTLDLDLGLGPEGTHLALAAEQKLELYQNHVPFRAAKH